MSILIAIILGVVQGFTEFIPVSSSGHLVLLQKILGVQGDGMFFNIVVHLGSLLAVIICYRKKILGIIKNPLGQDAKRLIIATIPTVIIFFLFKDFFDKTFGGEYLVICFLVTATMLIISSIVAKCSNKNPLNNKTAFVMGVFQGLAIIPGISRSGATLTGGVCMGADKENVADFSFLMSGPIIVGSLILELFKKPTLPIGILPLIAGFIFSFIASILAIKFMLKVLKTKTFIPFAIYLLALSLALIIF